jgi:hypothetical protein
VSDKCSEQQHHVGSIIIIDAGHTNSVSRDMCAGDFIDGRKESWCSETKQVAKF